VPPAGDAAVVVQIPPESVEQLEQMGFSRPEAQRALQATRGDVNAAISLLLGS
jgi:NACalpha-BTF3-like transcription factor